jgi:hypothetical protein
MSTLESNPPADGRAAETSTRSTQAPVSPPAVGRFRYDALTDTWWWSEEMYAMHRLGCESPLTTSVILSLKHAEDRGETEATLRRAMETGGAFNQPHRIVTADGAVRHVISVGEGIVLGGRVVAVHGYMADVTDSLERQVQTDGWQEASRVIEQRAVIERAKGALMVRYGLDADAAFELLKSWSSTRNQKLRDVARQVVESL